jgi:asparagine synthase (glutamine-hydrolysing)
MCGIAGIFKLYGSTTPEDVAAVQQMLDAQVHRGPDGGGIVIPPTSWPAIVLGHRRLAIIDLSEAGVQPMSNEACAGNGRSRRRVWVTYNGEIYNFRKLREALRGRGHTFKSQTDTEVLVHGYEEWGIEGLLSRLRGMFAFALYDSGLPSSTSCFASSQLILAKDRFGIKPLYYYQDRDRLIFASEVRALIRSGMVQDEKSLEALVGFLQLGSVPVPLTTTRDILALPAGHYLVVDERGSKLKPYWDLSTAFTHLPNLDESHDLEQAITTSRTLLDESVELHLISDVPLGVFLSGGIDSSALVALASGLREEPLTTISIVFEEPQYSEAQYARLVAERYRTDHREVLLRSKDLFEELPRLFAAMDQPTVDGVNSYIVSKVAKQAGLTVVLSGIGGDEVFLGYDHLRTAHALNGSRDLFARLPRWARKSLLKGVLKAAALAGRHGLEKLAYLEEPSDANVYLLFRGLFTPRQIQDLLGISEREFTALDPISTVLNGAQPRSLIDSSILFEFNHYLQNQLLKDADCMSMAHSIETRVPYLDHRLVDHVLGLPAGMKLRNGINKPLLLKSLGDDLPREVWDRQKMGFTFPFVQWMKQRVEELQSRSLRQKILQRRAVESVWKGFKEGRVHWSRAWALVVLG